MSSNANGEAKALKKPSLYHRQSSTLSYNTFPTAPPAQRRQTKDMKANGEPQSPGSRDSGSSSRSSKHHETPLPTGQLTMLAVIALAEQTALNSISPYLPEMASSFPDVNPEQVGMYVGLIASAFALAQFATNFVWGWLSDKVGRKPIILAGTFFTACCFVAFGFCRTLWQAVLVQALMGLLNGNQGVVSTCLGELTDRSNQSRAFKYLPVIYGIGGITGPIIGGVLVSREDPFHPGKPNLYPYLLPNLFSAGVLIIDLILIMFFLKESLETAQDLPPLGKRVGSLFAWMWQFTSAHRPSYLRRSRKRSKSSSYQRIPNGAAVGHRDESAVEDTDEDIVSEAAPTMFPDSHGSLSKSDVFTRDTVLILITFLVFQLANISYNTLYPVFSQGRPPTGRGLNTEEIGVSLAFAGVVTIVFQIGIFGKLREKAGNKATYRASLAIFVVAFLLMPWIGYKDGDDGSGSETTMGHVWLWVELGAVLVLKTVASVGGLTSALLLVTNSAPSHDTLGTLNGLAQTLSAAGRALGPFISGSLYSAATRVKPKGEALAFGVFGGITFLGFLLSFGIRSANLEDDNWNEESDSDEEETIETDTDASPERTR